MSIYDTTTGRRRSTVRDLEVLSRLTVAGREVVTGAGNSWFVDGYQGDDDNSGRSWEAPLATMRAALAACETLDTIYFVGKIAEQLTIADTGLSDLNLKFDVTIVGCGSSHHADQPGSGATAVHTGAAVWQPAASPEATTPLLGVYGRGWNFVNILFDAPADASAVKLIRNAGDGLSEYDAGHASFYRCDFRNGLYGIQDSGGCFNVKVEKCVFETLDATASAAGIVYSDTLNAPRRWRIEDNYFQGDSTTEGNERHIVSPLCGSLIKGNVFGTTKGTGRYVDLDGGQGNTVTQNTMGGVYATSDYRSGTNDVWFGNWCNVTATTAPSGFSILIPAA